VEQVAIPCLELLRSLSGKNKLEEENILKCTEARICDLYEELKILLCVTCQEGEEWGLL